LIRRCHDEPHLAVYIVSFICPFALPDPIINLICGEHHRRAQPRTMLTSESWVGHIVAHLPFRTFPMSCSHIIVGCLAHLVLVASIRNHASACVAVSPRDEKMLNSICDIESPRGVDAESNLQRWVIQMRIFSLAFVPVSHRYERVLSRICHGEPSRGVIV